MRDNEDIDFGQIVGGPLDGAEVIAGKELGNVCWWGWSEAHKWRWHGTHGSVEPQENRTVTIGHTELAIPGVGGVRFEDVYHVTAQGPVALHPYPVAPEVAWLTRGAVRRLRACILSCLTRCLTGAGQMLLLVEMADTRAAHQRHLHPVQHGAPA